MRVVKLQQRTVLMQASQNVNDRKSTLNVTYEEEEWTEE